MAKKKAKELDLADILAGELNKNSKDSKVFFLNDDSAPTNVDGWISTGCLCWMYAISNQLYGGLPVGRITEVTGLEQSGKSLVSEHLLAETQKQGGVVVLIDTETAVSREFLELSVLTSLNFFMYQQIRLNKSLTLLKLSLRKLEKLRKIK